MSDQDYYSILGISASASTDDIKKAFWRLAKKFHPDKNPGNEKTAGEKFKKILTAYKVLIKQETQKIYNQTPEHDQAPKEKRNEAHCSYRENLFKKARKDETYMCQLILLELINHNTQLALELYESLISRMPHFSLDIYMSDADVRDCEFLLAEAYHRRGNLSQAVWLYEKVLERESRKAYFHNFAQEIKSMLKNIYIQYINRSKRPEEISDIVGKIISMGIPMRESAWIHKKAAEAYYRANDRDSAVESLKLAFQINPKLPGAKKIKRRLEIYD